MDKETAKIFQLGKGFELGIIPYNKLTESQKFDIRRYYAMKNEILDDKIANVSNELSIKNDKLDSIYNKIQNFK